MQKDIQALSNNIAKRFIGKESVIHNMIVALLSGGHALIEDVPGVGKTTLAKVMAQSIEADFGRIQFTPDTLPTDVIGTSVFNSKTSEFQIVKGPVHNMIVLADEINRTTPRTQSALLEAMEEGHITVEGETRSLPDPFIVIATQNPVGAAGTQMLPDSRLDRFMIRLSMGYPKPESEVAMMKARTNSDPMEEVSAVLGKEALIACRKAADSVFVHDAIYRYVTDLVNRTRNHPMISLGVSPRGSLALIAMAKANAFFSGRHFVLPEDVADSFTCTVAHRLILTSTARAQKADVKFVAQDILRNVPAPKVSEAGR